MHESNPTMELNTETITKKKAVLIGCSYLKAEKITKSYGSHNDALLMKNTLNALGYETFLMLDNSPDYMNPNLSNISRALNWLTKKEDLNEDQDLIFYFSGVGTRYKVANVQNITNTGLVVDHAVICVTDVWNHVKRMNRYSTITVIIDAANGFEALPISLPLYSDSVIADERTLCTMEAPKRGRLLPPRKHDFKDVPRAQLSCDVDNIQNFHSSTYGTNCYLMAACSPGETAYEWMHPQLNIPVGVFTTAILEVFNDFLNNKSKNILRLSCEDIDENEEDAAPTLDMAFYAISTTFSSLFKMLPVEITNGRSQTPIMSFTKGSAIPDYLTMFPIKEYGARLVQDPETKIGFLMNMASMVGSMKEKANIPSTSDGVNSLGPRPLIETNHSQGNQNIKNNVNNEYAIQQHQSPTRTEVFSSPSRFTANHAPDQSINNIPYSLPSNPNVTSFEPRPSLVANTLPVSWSNAKTIETQNRNLPRPDYGDNAGLTSFKGSGAFGSLADFMMTSLNDDNSIEKTKTNNISPRRTLFVSNATNNAAIEMNERLSSNHNVKVIGGGNNVGIRGARVIAI